ncbi:putative membrane-associated kinase regulator 2 [Apostasia shenzhenica]|uniref:Putative membrane-associated kinase regulator 2 n=1 Tax=Apostasia shenzhenica TaxID=1088818 RepID=A0A2I0B6F2_9ASPA|nr:putative membrane-associated kinase regulator 2 [Apostasia shenzhenica]
MESFSLLKYWRGGGAPAAASTVRAAAISSPDTMRPVAEADGGDDEGPFFDLDFAVSDEHAAAGGGGEKDESEESEAEEERELCLSMTSPEGPLLSPSDDLFFTGGLGPLETKSIIIAAEENDLKPQVAVSLLKSATRLRVFMLGRRKPKPRAVESVAAPSLKQSQQQGNFLIKFKVDEGQMVPLFLRDGSGRNAGSDGPPAAPEPEEKKQEERKMASASKEVVQKYLSKIKPFYVKVSKRYAEKMRFSGSLVSGDDPFGTPADLSESEEKHAEARPAKAGEKSLKSAMPSRLRVVYNYKRLGKSKSASAAVASVSSPPQRRRDDSLLQVEDGIQGAIAHCKRSFTAASKGAIFKTEFSPPFSVGSILIVFLPSADSESPLTRSNSDPGESCSSDCS